MKRAALSGTEAGQEHSYMGNLIESIAQTSREDPFEGCVPIQPVRNRGAFGGVFAVYSPNEAELGGNPSIWVADSKRQSTGKIERYSNACHVLWLTSRKPDPYS